MFTKNLSIQLSTFAEHKLHVYQSTFICPFTCNFSTENVRNTISAQFVHYLKINRSGTNALIMHQSFPFFNIYPYTHICTFICSFLSRTTLLSLHALIYQGLFIYSYKITQSGKKVQLCKSRNSREFQE
jgi:hypothetical protein